MTERRSTRSTRITRRTLTAWGAGLTGALAVACGTGSGATGESAPSTKPVGTATYLHHQVSGPELDRYVKLAEMFAQKSSGSGLKTEIIPTTQGMNARTKLLAMVAGGEPPDGAFTESWNIPEYAERGLVADLDPYVRRDKWDLKQFFDATVALCRWKVQGTEHLYALPRHPSPLALFYSKDKFERAGIKPPDATWTWDTVLENARKMTTGSTWGVLAPLTIPHHIFPVVRSMGGEVLDKDWKKMVLEQPAGANAVQWAADLMVRHRVAAPLKDLTGTGDRTPFFQGNAAMAPDIFPFIGTVHDRTGGAMAFDVAPMPKGPSGRVNRNVAGTYLLLKGGKNPQVGWEFLKFLSSKEAQVFLAQAGAVFPSLREAAKSPEVLNPPAPSAQVNRKVFIDALENDKQIPEPALPVWDEITALLTKELVPVWNGEKDARSVLQAVKPQVDGILNK